MYVVNIIFIHTHRFNFYTILL